MSASYALAKGVLEHVTGTASYATQQLFVSLHTASPGTTGANEVSNATYSRVTTGAFGSVTTSICTNSSVLTFATDGNGETVSHAGLWHGLSTGTFICGGALSSAFSYNNAVTPVFDLGNLKLVVS